jgi:hypothetical protein
MDEVERLHNIVVMLSSHMALTQYRLAFLEGETEGRAFAHLQTVLASTLAMLEDVDIDDLSAADLQAIEETAVKLVRSLDTGKSFN